MSNFKTWANNEILTAADLNALLMQQVIVSVEDATERASLPSAVRAVYREDLDVIQIRLGSTWKTVETTSDRGAYAPSTSAITKGSGSSEAGFYSVQDGWCDFTWGLTFGSSASISNEARLTSLPVPADAAWAARDQRIGNGVFRDASQSATSVLSRVPLEMIMRGDNGNILLTKAYTGPSAIAVDYASLSVSNSAFPALAAGDTITVVGRYPIAL